MSSLQAHPSALHASTFLWSSSLRLLGLALTSAREIGRDLLGREPTEADPWTSLEGTSGAPCDGNPQHTAVGRGGLESVEDAHITAPQLWPWLKDD